MYALYLEGAEPVPGEDFGMGLVLGEGAWSVPGAAVGEEVPGLNDGELGTGPGRRQAGAGPGRRQAGTDP